MGPEAQGDDSASFDLRAFAAEARRRIARIDARLAHWIEAALLAADPYPVTLAALRRLQLGRARAIAVGKAAVPMALAWNAAGGRPGLAVVPVGTRAPRALSGWRIIEGEHPFAGPGSLEAGRAATEVASTGDEIVLLLSGGASAMIEAPVVPPSEHAGLARELRALGLPIATWNAARALLSRLKSGGFARLVQQAGGALRTLYVSDVPGDDPAVVGSGPGTPVSNEELVRRIEGVPEGLYTRLVVAAQARPEPAAATHTACILPRDAAARHALSMIQADGERARLLDPLDVPVAEAAKQISAVAEREGDAHLVLWGEPLVRLPENPGPGGRTTVLLSLLWARGIARGGAAAIAGTDGVDGDSGFGASFARLEPEHAKVAERAVREWQTARFLAGLPQDVGGGVPAQATGTNLADVGVLKIPE